MVLSRSHQTYLRAMELLLKDTVLNLMSRIYQKLGFWNFYKIWVRDCASRETAKDFSDIEEALEQLLLHFRQICVASKQCELIGQHSANKTPRRGNGQILHFMKQNKWCSDVTVFSVTISVRNFL